MSAIVNYGSMNFSTDEQIVGKWFNGKPIYQKAVDFGSAKSVGTTWTDIGIDSTNIETVINCRGIHADGTCYALSVDPTLSSHTVLGAEFTNACAIKYLWIQYTKTTD